MIKYYTLIHQWYDKINYEEKYLGVFSTLSYLDEAICDYKKLPGFKEHVEGFYVKQFMLDSDFFQTVKHQYYDESHIYLLTHSYYDEDDNEWGSYLGTYSSIENAIKSQDKYKELPLFSKSSDGFYIAKVVLNEREWMDGFFTTFHD